MTEQPQYEQEQEQQELEGSSRDAHDPHPDTGVQPAYLDDTPNTTGANRTDAGLYQPVPAPAPGAEASTKAAAPGTDLEADTQLAPDPNARSPHLVRLTDDGVQNADAEPEDVGSGDGRTPAQLWQFVDVIAGKFAGLYGAYVGTLERDQDGRPVKIVVRNRDHSDAPAEVVVDYENVRQSRRTGGR